MQTLGMTLATAATDVSADSAAQTNATAAPSGAGAIFEILMAAASGPTPETPADPNAVMPITPSDAITISAETPAPTGDLASDLEQMVQALAITAEVVAQGMAARTTPVREIILTVEAPKAEGSAETPVTQLSINVPTSSEQTLSLKVSDADPSTNLDPALVALMPKLLPTPTAQTQDTAQAVHGADMSNISDEPVSDTAAIAEMPAPQPSSTLKEEIYGPWRAEIHGPILNAQRELIVQPVHVPVFEVPAHILASAPVVETAETVPMVTNTPSEPNTVLSSDTLQASPGTMAEMPIRVVTIRVPVKVAVASDSNENDAAEATPSTTASDPIDSSALDQVQTMHIIIATPDFIGPQMIPMGPLPIQPTSEAPADNEKLADALDAPRPALTNTPALVVSTDPTDKAKLTVSAPLAPLVLAQSAADMPGYSTDQPQFDVAAVVAALQEDADLSRAAHRRADDVHQYDSKNEMNLPNPVAKTSSRSMNDIRDIMKLGVRDIEIVQGNGSTQSMNVNPQLQTIDPTGASVSTRAQVTDAFAPNGNESNSTDRRAQAHEIRMRAIERQVVSAVRDGADTIRMQLYPPGLGQIIIRLTMDGSKLKLSTSANSRDAAESLRTIEGDLRDALSVGGLELTGFDVSEDGESGNKNRKNASETENDNQHSRSAKSDDFALDMNA